MDKNYGKIPELKPLRITCTSSNCESNLHCFKKTKKMAAVDRGKCRTCGVSLIDWRRVHKRDLSDVNYTFQALKLELFRHHYWHKELDEKVIAHAKRKGKKGLRESAKKRLLKTMDVDNPFDGRQTPLDGNIIYYAQHALACCCRTCMEYWHSIPKDKEIRESQIDYFVNLIMMYIDERMPDLSEDGEFVPRKHKRMNGESNENKRS